MMKELNTQHKPISHNFGHHHLKKYAELLQTRKSVFAFEKFRQLFELLNESGFLGSRHFHVEAVDGLLHLKFGWVEFGGVDW